MGGTENEFYSKPFVVFCWLIAVVGGLMLGYDIGISGISPDRFYHICFLFLSFVFGFITAFHYFSKMIQILILSSVFVNQGK